MDTSNVVMPSRQVLADTPNRAVKFLRALGTEPVIRAALAKAGYHQEDHAEGWSLVLKVAGYSMGAAAPANPAVQAQAELDAWRTPGLLRARSALKHLFPAQEEFVFGDLNTDPSVSSVAAISAFLDRLDALESGSDRKGTRKADHAALELLARREIGEEVRVHLRQLVALASVEATAAPIEAPEAVTARGDELLALYRWLEDWSNTARAMVARRGDLIRLGLVGRRPRRKPAVVTPATPAAPPPVVIPPVVVAPVAPVAPVAVPIEILEQAPPSRAA